MKGIIDFRLRPPTPKFAESFIFREVGIMEKKAQARGFSLPTSVTTRSMERLIEEMDGCGIAIGVVGTRRGTDLGDVSNEEMATLVRQHGDRFVAFAAPDPKNLAGAADELEEATKSGLFKGVNIESGRFLNPLYSDDRRLYPLYERMERIDVPVMIMGGGSAGPDPTYSSPTLLAHVAKDFPRLKIIAAHGGWPFVHEMLNVAYQYENIYVCPDCYFFGMAGWRDYVDAARGYLRHRFLFGTAYPLLPLEPCVGRFREMFGSDDEELLSDLMIQNARLLLKL